MEAQERKNVLAERAATYELLAGLFLQEATAGFLERLRDDAAFADGPLGDYAASLSGVDAEQARIEAAADYAALFLGMSAQPVPPYESVYTSELQLLMQEARDRAVETYRAHGFTAAADFNLPEDHAGVELQFMARLCRAELATLDAGDEAKARRLADVQATFLQEHLLSWMPRLCDDVEKRAKTGLYRGLARMTRQFLEFEREELAE
ncbi:MAG TPA: molecular chaperone TorD family protein [Candidatus Aphodovivens avistercoris]|nr:molecular chaperone TorD family protein [Candidatus Aphodovivens avistercoris]